MTYSCAEKDRIIKLEDSLVSLIADIAVISRRSDESAQASKEMRCDIKAMYDHLATAVQGQAVADSLFVNHVEEEMKAYNRITKAIEELTGEVRRKADESKTRHEALASKLARHETAVKFVESLEEDKKIMRQTVVKWAVGSILASIALGVTTWVANVVAAVK